MVMYSLTFQFPRQSPALDRVLAAVQRQTTSPAQLEVKRRNFGYISIGSPVEAGSSVGVTSDADRVQLEFGVSCNVSGIVTRALESLGGVHPPAIDPDEPNPDYGECWLGILAEGDDWHFAWNERRFVLWSRHLTGIESALPPERRIPFLEGAEDLFWEGTPFELDATAFRQGLRAVFEGTRDADGLEHHLVALAHLDRFLEEALSLAAKVVCRAR